jgi:hypothetical protein
MRTFLDHGCDRKAPEVVVTKRKPRMTELTRIVTGSLAERGADLQRQEWMGKAEL